MKEIGVFAFTKDSDTYSWITYDKIYFKGTVPPTITHIWDNLTTLSSDIMIPAGYKSAYEIAFEKDKVKYTILEEADIDTL